MKKQIVQLKIGETLVYPVIDPTLLKQVPVGEFIIWEGNRLVENNGQFHHLGTFYFTNEHLNKKFPEVRGFRKKYQMELTYTDNKPGTGYVYIHLSNNNDTWSYDLLFDPTWGGIDDNVRRTHIINIPKIIFDNLTSWWKIYGTPDWATGGAVRYYKISILVYYEPI